MIDHGNNLNPGVPTESPGQQPQDIPQLSLGPEDLKLTPSELDELVNEIFPQQGAIKLHTSFFRHEYIVTDVNDIVAETLMNTPRLRAKITPNALYNTLAGHTPETDPDVCSRYVSIPKGKKQQQLFEEAIEKAENKIRIAGYSAEYDEQSKEAAQAFITDCLSKIMKEIENEKEDTQQPQPQPQPQGEKE